MRSCLQILINAVELGFEIEERNRVQDEVMRAERFMCEHQTDPNFIKEMHIDLYCKRAFGYPLTGVGWVDVDSHVDLIDWSQYPDCKDDDKIFFYSALDSDFKTVLRFYDYGRKRHLA